MNVLTPDLGVEKAELSEWLVQVGDTVTQGQSLLLAESSKASMEIPSPAAGVVKTLLLPQGATLKEGVPLLELDSAAPSAEAAPGVGPETQKDAQTDSPSSAARQSPVDQAVDNPVDNPAPDPAKPSPVETSADHGASPVTVPDLGVEEATVAELLVQVGDTVTEGQSLLLAESSKAALEIPSPTAGVVTAIEVQVGQTLRQGDALLTLQGNASPAAPPSAAKPSQPLVHSSGSSANKSAAPSAPAAVLSLKNPADSASTVQKSATAYAGPAVRKLARQMGIDLGQVQPSLPTGRLLKEDLYQHVKQQLHAAPAASQTTQSGPTGLPPLPDFARWGGGEVQTLSKLQQAAIVHLAKNQFIPQVTQFDQADITELEALRQQLKDDYKKQGTSLTILAFIAKALAFLLREEPRFNSHLQDGQTLLLRHEIHLGIAVATEDGLIVPVLRHPDQKGIGQIAAELQALGQKARERKLSPADLAGATMTITSLGAIGGTAFTPLVSWPEVAILGISPAAMQPVWDGQAFAPRLMLPLSLSYDHRVINGADAARFTHRLAELLGDMRRVLL